MIQEKTNLPADRDKRNRKIERIAAEERTEAGINEPPVNVAAVARQLGIRIRRTELGPAISGVLVREGKRAVIGIHWKHHPNRQRFSIAHELGHFQLHGGGTYVDQDVTARFRDQASGAGTMEEEIDANVFAAALLMPSEWVRKAFAGAPLRFGDDKGLERLARKFGVSTQAMSYRLASLNLLEL